MQHPFKQLLLTYIHLTDEEWLLIRQHLIETTWNKGELISPKVPQSGDLFFMQKGLLRFFLSGNDGERTFLFKEAPYSFFGGQEIKNGQSVQALERTTIWCLPKEFVLKMSFVVKEWDLFITRLIGEIRKHHLQVQDATEGMSAEDWYMRMLTNCDPILARIPTKFLAAYLGISTPSLRDLRKKLMSEMSLSRYITASA